MYHYESISDAQVLIPRYDDNGNMYTIIVRRSSQQKSEYRPTRLLDNQLRKNGSSLRGAKDAARSIMGTTSMHPFLIQTHPDLHVWFPCESPRNQTCAYFCLHQIINYDKYLGSETNTIVNLHGNYAVVIPVAKSKFEGRFREAHCFRSKAYDHRTFSFELSPLGQKQILQCAEMRADYLV